MFAVTFAISNNNNNDQEGATPASARPAAPPRSIHDAQHYKSLSGDLRSDECFRGNTAECPADVFVRLLRARSGTAYAGTARRLDRSMRRCYVYIDCWAGRERTVRADANTPGRGLAGPGTHLGHSTSYAVHVLSPTACSAWPLYLSRAAVERGEHIAPLPLYNSQYKVLVR